jgi:hypothetical protein
MPREPRCGPLKCVEIPFESFTRQRRSQVPHAPRMPIGREGGIQSGGACFKRHRILSDAREYHGRVRIWCRRRCPVSNHSDLRRSARPVFPQPLGTSRGKDKPATKIYCHVAAPPRSRHSGRAQTVRVKSSREDWDAEAGEICVTNPHQCRRNKYFDESDRPSKDRAQLQRGARLPVCGQWPLSLYRSERRDTENLSGSHATTDRAIWNLAVPPHCRGLPLRCRCARIEVRRKSPKFERPGRNCTAKTPD